jgi:hypothetical protein
MSHEDGLARELIRDNLGGVVIVGPAVAHDIPIIEQPYAASASRELCPNAPPNERAEENAMKQGEHRHLWVVIRILGIP